MRLQDELVTFLKARNKVNEKLERDIELILHFFGFGDDPCPTLESTGEKFDNLTRERIRQILEKKFRSKMPQDYPWIFMDNMINELATYKYYSDDIFYDVVKKFTANESVSIKGLLNLMNELRPGLSYNTYDEHFNEIPRSSKERIFVIEENTAFALRGYWQRLLGFPGRDGLIVVDDALDFLKVDQELKNVLKSHISISTEVKVFSCNGKNMYIAEERDNVIENTIKKIYATADEFSIAALARGVALNFSKRNPERFDYPNIQEIEAYLARSSYISLNLLSSKYKTLLKPDVLTDGENALLDFLKTNKVSTFPQIKEALLKKGIGKDHIVKLIKSPFIFEDSSEGRTKYVYTLLSDWDSRFDHLNVLPEIQTNESLKDKLLEIAKSGTDMTSEGTHRAEQHILRNCLFGKQDIAECGICAKEFPIQALVVAHKKKRSECSEEERLDPDVVMPMCVFGCDFLYEKGFITIHEGMVEMLSDDVTDAIRTYLQKIVGNRLDERWYKGIKYFNHHRSAHLKKVA